MQDICCFLRKNCEYIDISDKKIIIWGAGNNTKNLCASLQLGRLSYVVDRAYKEKKIIILYGKEYSISSPDILNDLNPLEYVIIIASTKYRDEIKSEIIKKYGEKYLICESESDFVRGYHSVEAMFWDPCIVKKVSNGNISLMVGSYIKKLNSIITNYICEGEKIAYYYPIKEGIRVSFIIQTLTGDKYVAHFPTKKNREDYTPSDDIYIREAYHARQIASFDKNLLVYLDEGGIEITRFADINIPWEEENTLNRILKSIRAVHKSGVVVQASRCPLDRVAHKENFIKNYRSYFPDAVSNLFWNVCAKEMRDYIPAICNGDFHKGNVVIYKGNIEIIDWEWIGMSDPLWDIAQFMCDYWKGAKSTSKLMLEDVLFMYNGRKPTEKEILHATILMIAAHYFSYLCWLIEYDKVDYTREKSIVERMDDLLR